MSAITYSENILLIGKYGKILVAIIGILTLQKSYIQFDFFLKKYRWLFLFWVLCIIFTIFRILNHGINFLLIQNNLLFILFIYFFYLLSSNFQARYRKPNFHFFKYLAIAINTNLFFWTTISFIFSFKIWHTLDDRTGLGLFYENYVQLGVFAAVGAITNFFLLSYKTRRNRLFYFFMFSIFICLVILSNSRNSQLIVATFLFLNVFSFLKNLTIKYIYILVFSLFILSFFYFSSDLLLTESITDFSTGRSAIWYYVFEYYSQNSIFLGEGIFGLNSTILQDNLGFNYYFQRLDFLYFHSSYVEVFCASGLIGFIFFMVFIIKSLRERKQFYNVIIIISILVGGLFESFLVQPTILISFLFWYLIIGKIPNLSKQHSLKINSKY